MLLQGRTGCSACFQPGPRSRTVGSLLAFCLVLLGCHKEVGTSRPQAPSSSASRPPTAGALASPGAGSHPAARKSHPEGEQAAPAIQSEYSIWLYTTDLVSLSRARDGFLVFIEARESGFTVPPGYLLDADRLTEQASLLVGFPEADPTQFPPGLARRPIHGRIAVSGSWPDRAGAVRYEMPNGGCIGCYEEYDWRNGHWVSVGQRPIEPAWFDIAEMGPAPRGVRWDNGVTFWEKYDREEDSSVLYLDPQGRRRAQRQRAPCANKGAGKLRLQGELSAVGLSDGSLLSVGVDCVTARPAVELWRQGSLTSSVLPLPGEPGSIEGNGPFVDPVSYLVRSPSDVVIAFQSTRGDAQAPYLAAYDGKAWVALWPPIEGNLLEAVRDGSGAIWLRAYTDHQTIWRHPRPGGANRGWSEIALKDLDGDARLRVSPSGTLLVLNGSRLEEWKTDWFASHPLPTLDQPHGKDPCRMTELAFLAHEPVMIAACGDRSVLLRQKAAKEPVRR